jgi:hypothetical protein
MHLVFGLGLLLVYLVLAGQYESWLPPISVLLAVLLSARKRRPAPDVTPQAPAAPTSAE